MNPDQLFEDFKHVLRLALSLSWAIPSDSNERDNLVKIAMRYGLGRVEARDLTNDINSLNCNEDGGHHDG